MVSNFNFDPKLIEIERFFFFLGMYTVYVEDFMVRGVKYIFRTMTYEQLYTVLKDNKNLHSFPIVDNPDSMVLLGSIQRMHLIQLIDKQIGKETRLQVVAERRREAQKQREEEEKRQAEDRQRRPSRFQVVPVSSENQLNVERVPRPKMYKLRFSKKKYLLI